jgi:hypothetical protein
MTTWPHIRPMDKGPLAPVLATRGAPAEKPWPKAAARKQPD